jgi:hypothetical protein
MGSTGADPPDVPENNALRILSTLSTGPTTNTESIHLLRKRLENGEVRVVKEDKGKRNE